jgi:hypothetical protein
VDEEILIKVHEKCTKQLVLNVKRNVKFHLNQTQARKFSVETVFKNENQNDTENLMIFGPAKRFAVLELTSC